MKKLLAILMIMVMILGMSSIAYASNGKGKGLATAPGQADNFSKGITTVVTVEDKTIESEDVDVQESEDVSIETKSETTVTTNTTDEKVLVYHENAFKPGSNQAGWYRYNTLRTTVTTTTTKTWDETTTTTTTTMTVTPITTVETNEFTLKHHGAPGSDGAVISKDSRNISSVTTKGEPVVTTVTNTEVTLGEVTTKTDIETSTKTIEGEGWIKP